MRVPSIPHSLPLKAELETPEILRQLVSAHARLAELRGLVALLEAKDLFLMAPRLEALGNLLLPQEALASLSIEGVGCTYDRLLQSQLLGARARNKSEQALHQYMQAYRQGAQHIRTEGGWLAHAHLWNMHAVLVGQAAGYREGPGALVKNLQTQEIVYTPPQQGKDVRALMDNLLVFMKDESAPSLDPLVKLAVLHYQFELIRPFASHNGRMGRLLNLLYLRQKHLLEPCVLVLSRGLERDKTAYYNLLRHANSEANSGHSWTSWILFMLRRIEDAARDASITIWNIIILMRRTHKALLRQAPKFYRPPHNTGLLHNIFAHPYTNIELVMRDMDVSRLTAAKYLNALASGASPLLQTQRHGRNNFFINRPLLDVLSQKVSG